MLPERKETNKQKKKEIRIASDRFLSEHNRS